MKTSTEIAYILNPKEILNTTLLEQKYNNGLSIDDLVNYVVDTSILYLENVYVNELQNIFQIKKFQQLFKTKDSIHSKNAVPEILKAEYDLSEYFLALHCMLTKNTTDQFYLDNILTKVRNKLENMTNTTDDTKLIKYSYYAILIITICYYYCICQNNLLHHMTGIKFQKTHSNISYFRCLLMYDIKTYKYFKENFYSWLTHHFPYNTFNNFSVPVNIN